MRKRSRKKSSMPVFCDPVLEEKLKDLLQGENCHTFAGSPHEAFEQSRRVRPDESCYLIFRSEMPISGPAAVSDQINLSYENPLVGQSAPPRFPDMSRVYESGDGQGCIVAMGDLDKLKDWSEPTIPVTAGLWDAIALKHRGVRIRGWVVYREEELNSIRTLINA
jgi:hypothetical protein